LVYLGLEVAFFCILHNKEQLILSGDKRFDEGDDVRMREVDLQVGILLGQLYLLLRELL
jgi:hypothetical protein